MKIDPEYPLIVSHDKRGQPVSWPLAIPVIDPSGQMEYVFRLPCAHNPQLWYRVAGKLVHLKLSKISTKS